MLVAISRPHWKYQRLEILLTHRSWHPCDVLSYIIRSFWRKRDFRATERVVLRWKFAPDLNAVWFGKPATGVAANSKCICTISAREHPSDLYSYWCIRPGKPFSASSVIRHTYSGTLLWLVCLTRTAPGGQCAGERNLAQAVWCHSYSPAG